MKPEKFLTALNMIDERYLDVETRGDAQSEQLPPLEYGSVKSTASGRKKPVLLRALPALCGTAACIAGGILLLKHFTPQPYTYMQTGSQLLQDAEPQTVTPLAAFLAQQPRNAWFTPIYEISATKTLLEYQKNTGTEQNPNYKWVNAVYDSSTGTLSEPIVCDITPQCRESGFWVMKRAGEDENAMEYTGLEDDFRPKGTHGRYSALLMYDYDLNLTAEVDLRGCGLITAIEADPAAKSVYFCTGSETGTPQVGDLITRRIVQRSADGKTEKELYQFSHTFTIEPQTLQPGAFPLAGIYKMVLQGDSLIFTGFGMAETTGTAPHIWGIFNCKTCEMTLRDTLDFWMELRYAKGCAVISRKCDSPNIDPFCKWVLPDGTVKDIPVQSGEELYADVNAVSSGGQFYATVKGNSTVITVYDRSGNAVLRTDLAPETEEGIRPEDLFILEDSRTVLANIDTKTERKWFAVPF